MLPYTIKKHAPANIIFFPRLIIFSFPNYNFRTTNYI
jgi:hypothetical protein